MKKLREQIIKICIFIGKKVLNVIYFFVKICPTKNKIVMLSRQSNTPSIDFELIEKEILKRTNSVDVKILCRTIKFSLKEIILYGIYILKNMYHIATSRVCILDSYSIPISILKHKKDLKIIQIWHASGAIKKFGYQSLNKKDGRGTDIAKTMNMHRNYSYVMAPTEVTGEVFSEAFKIDKDKIFINCLPRIDYLLDEEVGEKKVNKFYQDNPKLKNKKTILYVPTFRKNKDCTDIVNGLINSINSEKYNLIIKLHPLDKNSEIKEFCVGEEYTTFDLIKLADYIITDYSAVAFEASILNKPIYFYVYDIEEYEELRGLNIDLLQELSNATSKKITEIIKKIEDNTYDYEQLENFKIKYMGKNYYNNTEKLVEFIFKYLDKDVKNEKNKNNSYKHSEEKLNV